MNQLLIHVAEVLEKTAAYVDEIENREKTALRDARNAQITELSDKYAAATGEELPDTLRQKLATSDKDVLELLRQTVEKTAGEVPALGGPSQRNDSSAPSTVKEAADAAEDRFVNWIVS